MASGKETKTAPIVTGAAPIVTGTLPLESLTWDYISDIALEREPFPFNRQRLPLNLEQFPL